MGFAADQQHAQTVAHAVDLHHGFVVAFGQFAVHGRGGKLHHVHPAVGQVDWQFDVFIDRHLERHWWAAIDGNCKINKARLGRCTLILNPQGERDRFAEYSKCRRVADHKAAIPIVFVACQQNMQRRGQCCGGGWQIVQATVGDQHHTGDAGLRFLRQGLR